MALFGATRCDLTTLPASARFIAAGLPFDGTASSRAGAAEGPAAIRQSSIIFSSYIDSLGEHDMRDMRTGEVFRYQRPVVADAGDLHVYQTDTLRTFRAVAAEVRSLASTDATMLLMGGDHSITFPAFAGWRAAVTARRPGMRVAYVQLDHHFDFGDHSALHGHLYHGSTARRISELEGMESHRMAFVGVGSTTRKDQLDHLLASGCHVVPACAIAQRGAAEALAPVLADLGRCDAVYVSLDIDVLDASVAPGTGNVTVGGLTGAELFDVVAQLRTLTLGALDITEVAPRYDPTGRTQQIAARLLFELVYRRPPGASSDRNGVSS